MQVTQWNSTIPVFNMQDFFDPSRKADFINNVAKAGHEVGFFALENTGYDEAVLQSAYKAYKHFFKQPLELKMTIHDPALNGQRGFMANEKAQTGSSIDNKEYIHFGRTGNLYPDFMDLKTPTEDVIKQLDKVKEVVEKTFAIFIGEKEDIYVKQSGSQDGQCLIRSLYYPKGGSGAYKHTDIDDFTILPNATEKGLQIFHNNEWIDVVVPKGATIINIGDKWRNLSNGWLKSALHRVVVDPKVERRSIVYFVHSGNDDDRSPSAKWIALTGGIARYPTGTSIELLRPRIRETNNASLQMRVDEVNSGIMERHKELVLAGVADEPVKLTFKNWETHLVKNYTEVLNKKVAEEAAAAAVKE